MRKFLLLTVVTVFLLGFATLSRNVVRAAVPQQMVQVQTPNDYRVIQAPSETNLQTALNDAAKDGWTVVGFTFGHEHFAAVLARHSNK